MEIGLGAIAWWLLRPEKHAELKAIWNRKWNVPVTPAEITSAEVTPVEVTAAGTTPTEESASDIK